MSRTLWDRDVVSGSIFIALGGAALWYAHKYPLGTPSDMGAGFFPLILCAFLLVFGLSTLLAALLRNEPDPIPLSARRPFVAVTVSVVAFALLLDRIGLPLTIFVSSLIASAARPGFVRPANFVLAAVLGVLCVIVFVRLLSIPINVLPPALQGY